MLLYIYRNISNTNIFLSPLGQITHSSSTLGCIMQSGLSEQLVSCSQLPLRDTWPEKQTDVKGTLTAKNIRKRVARIRTK